TIDFVREHQVVKDRPALEFKQPGFGPIDFAAGDIGGQQIGGELYAVEVAFQMVGQGFYSGGFGQPGCAFHQQVAVGQQGNQKAVYQLVLANDPFCQLCSEGTESLL